MDVKSALSGFRQMLQWWDETGVDFDDIESGGFVFEDGSRDAAWSGADFDYVGVDGEVGLTDDLNNNHTMAL
uniref:Phage major capsid protein n=1 Tax=Panagrellus redivivus TaxID=6233 RepID=A0A7E4VGI6_PANRE